MLFLVPKVDLIAIEFVSFSGLKIRVSAVQLRPWPPHQLTSKPTWQNYNLNPQVANAICRARFGHECLVLFAEM
jgi:hypothetical protein